MHKNVFAILPADKAVAFGVVKPLHCSLFHCVQNVPFNLFCLRWTGVGVLRAGASWFARSCSKTESNQTHL